MTIPWPLQLLLGFYLIGSYAVTCWTHVSTHSKLKWTIYGTNPIVTNLAIDFDSLCNSYTFKQKLFSGLLFPFFIHLSLALAQLLSISLQPLPSVPHSPLTDSSPLPHLLCPQLKGPSPIPISRLAAAYELSSRVAEVTQRLGYTF